MRYGYTTVRAAKHCRPGLLIAGFALAMIVMPLHVNAQQQNSGNSSGIDLSNIPGISGNDNRQNQQNRNTGNNPGLNLPTGNQQNAANRAAQQQMLQAPTRMQMRDRAFDSAVRGLFPLKPQEIRRFLQIYDTQQRAVETPLRDPEPRVSVKTISLDPGHRPLTINMAPDHVTTLSILDITGEPWPVKDMTWAGNFDIIEPESGGHIIRITPMSKTATGNISMQLKDLKIPVTMTLSTSYNIVQYRLDIRIPRQGPKAKSPLIEGGITTTAGNQILSRILEGVPPGKAELLKVQGTDSRTRAYALNGITYVRTPLTLLSPGWKESVRSADGMNVYALKNAPVLLLSDQGRMIRADVQKKDEKAQ